jgi:hypothetical protein
MYWYRFNNVDDKNNIITELEKLGLKKSRWSASDENAVAIALYIENSADGDKVYILLSENMCVADERRSWVLHRKEVENPGEFIIKTTELIKRLYETQKGIR